MGVGIRVGERWTLAVTSLVLGVLAVGADFNVSINLSPATPKPRDQVNVTCLFTLAHSETHQVAFYEQSEVICFFPVSGGTVRCPPPYNASVLDTGYSQQQPGVAWILLQLQTCSTLNKITCEVTDTAARPKSAEKDIILQNVPRPTISCVDTCEERTVDDQRQLHFATNSSHQLRCSVEGALPELSLSWSSSYSNAGSEKTLTNNCTYNQASTGSPSQPITASTQVTCTATAPDGTTASTSITVSAGTTPNNSGNAAFTTMALLPAALCASLLLG